MISFLAAKMNRLENSTSDDVYSSFFLSVILFRTSSSITSLKHLSMKFSVERSLSQIIKVSNAMLLKFFSPDSLNDNVKVFQNVKNFKSSALGGFFCGS